MQINVLEAKNRLSELIKAAEAGEEIIIARRGTPSVRLVPVSQFDGQALGSLQRLQAWQLAHQEPVAANRSGAEIDAAILAERDAWD